jgi:hypothetical protein
MMGWQILIAARAEHCIFAGVKTNYVTIKPF